MRGGKTKTNKIKVDEKIRNVDFAFFFNILYKTFKFFAQNYNML
jgi:hypothetical protein